MSILIPVYPVEWLFLPKPKLSMAIFKYSTFGQRGTPSPPLRPTICHPRKNWVHCSKEQPSKKGRELHLRGCKPANKKGEGEGEKAMYCTSAGKLLLVRFIAPPPPGYIQIKKSGTDEKKVLTVGNESEWVGKKFVTKTKRSTVQKRRIHINIEEEQSKMDFLEDEQDDFLSSAALPPPISLLGMGNGGGGGQTVPTTTAAPAPLLIPPPAPPPSRYLYRQDPAVAAGASSEGAEAHHKAKSKADVAGDFFGFAKGIKKTVWLFAARGRLRAEGQMLSLFKE